jgi:RNA-binding protein
MTLSGKHRRHLRGLGHHLQAIVQLGKGGLTEGVVKAVDAALEQHELVKIKIGPEAPENRHEVAELLASETKSEVAQVLGRTLLLYRRHPKDPKIVLPR